MEHYIASFCFEKSKNKTEGKNYLVIYTITENGSFGPLSMRMPEYRYVSKNHYSHERANWLLSEFYQKVDFSYESRLFFDNDTNSYRIHLLGGENLSKHIETKYKYKFFRQPQTDFFRTMFEGQDFKIPIAPELEEYLVDQKELNSAVRALFHDFVMPMRTIEREYALTHQDALTWINLKQKDKESLIRKIIRNKEKFAQVMELYKKFGEGTMQDNVLKEELSKILDKSKQKKNISDRVYRVFHTPDNLLGEDGLTKVVQEIEKKNSELDRKIKTSNKKNCCMLDLESMCARLMLESSIF